MRMYFFNKSVKLPTLLGTVGTPAAAGVADHAAAGCHVQLGGTFANTLHAAIAMEPDT